MDSETTKNRYKIYYKMFLFMVSAINLIISFFLCIAALSLYDRTSMGDIRFIILMIMVINITFFANILRLLFAVNNRKICDIRFYLEYFIVLFVLNIIPTITKQKEESSTCSYDQYSRICNLKLHYGKLDNVYDFIWINCNFVYVMLVLEIYSAYLYYNNQLKFPRQNVSPAPTLRKNPCAPTKLFQTTSEHNTTQRPTQNTSQPAGQNATCQLDQNATEQHIIHYVVHQPGKNVTQQPVTSAYDTQHVVQIPLRPDQSMTSTPIWDSEGSIAQQSFKPTSDPPPYSKSDDM